MWPAQVEVHLSEDCSIMHSVHDIELLTKREIMGLMRMGPVRATRLIKSLPPNAVIRSGRGNRFLVNSWALHRYLGMDTACPGCGRAWPKQEKQ